MGPFAIGARVRVLPTHWNARLHGHVGTVKTAGESAEGLPTHWVRFDSGYGQFVLAEEMTNADTRND